MVYYVSMYIETVPNRSSPPAILLRESVRHGAKVLKHTLANLSDWPTEKLNAMRFVLQGKKMVLFDDVFTVERSIPHGHVEAVLGTIRRLGLDSLIGTKRSRERDLIVSAIASRILFPASKLATTRHWESTTLPEELSIADADEDDLYDAMDWLFSRKDAIEKKLAQRHLSDGSLVLYDASSSFYTGHTCPLARFGHDRDKSGLPIILYGVLTDAQGRPVAVDIYPGNTADCTTVPDQANKICKKFGLAHMALVGDRGMITQVQITRFQEYPDLGWISALRSHSIQELLEAGTLQRSLFDQQNLAEISSPEFPGERLIACYNPLMAQKRARSREALLAATEQRFTRLAAEVKRRTKNPLSAARIGEKAGRLKDRYKMGKHFDLLIADGSFGFTRKKAEIAQEALADGIYVIRTSEPAERLSAEDTVRSYKSLAQVERAFRCLKGMDLMVRPIFHRTEERVKAHIFLCMLAYYVEWHMRQSLAPLLFADEDLNEDRKTRDAVAPAQPSASAREKKATHKTTDEFPAHSFQTLIKALGTRCRNLCRVKSASSKDKSITASDATSEATECLTTQITTPTRLQARAFELLGL